eukprot:Gb_39114 [translate_table: standard]
MILRSASLALSVISLLLSKDEVPSTALRKLIRGPCPLALGCALVAMAQLGCHVEITMKPMVALKILRKCLEYIKEEDPLDEETDKESDEDNDENFDSDDYEDGHKEEDCIQDKQLDKGYEGYDEDPDEDSDEECNFECEDNGYDQDVKEDCEDKDKEYQTKEGFPELESPPTSDNKDKIDETLEDKIVKLKGKDDDSNIPTFDQLEKPEEHEDGRGDPIIHVDDVDDGEMDCKENFCDEEDYDPDSYDKPKDTINEVVWDPFPIVSQTQYFGYNDLVGEDVDENGDRNEDYEGSDKNPNKEEDPKYEIFSEEYYSDKNPNEDPNEDIGE